MTAADTSLAALEQQVRNEIGAQIDTLANTIGVTLARAVKTDTANSGTEVLSRPDVDNAITAGLASTQTQTSNTISSGYSAAAKLAMVAVALELAKLGHDAKPQLPAPGPYLARILIGIGAAFGTARFDTHRRVSEAHDGITGDGAAWARVLATNAGMREAIGRLRARATAAGATAVHRGYTDAQLDLYQQYARINPYFRITKRWVTNGTDPCATCRALHGTEVGLDDEFDHTATEDDSGYVLPVYTDLLGPPRHPHCRCRIEFDTNP